MDLYICIYIYILLMLSIFSLVEWWLILPLVSSLPNRILNCCDRQFSQGIRRPSIFPYISLSLFLFLFLYLYVFLLSLFFLYLFYKPSRILDCCDRQFSRGIRRPSIFRYISVSLPLSLPLSLYLSLSFSLRSLYLFQQNWAEFLFVVIDSLAGD